MKRAALLAALLALAACQQDVLGRSNAELRKEEQACKAEGGTFRTGGRAAALMCFHQMEDAGQTCRRSTDCKSICLAKNETGPGQCAAEAPMFGCIDMFDENGTRATICID
ncbi:MAG: hypothetical protein RIA08_08635 [Roseovarius sp.]|uniref:hypothetical protein n=1 Tax=Roseobacteraceae TaxID=2854170 RepID=UPI0032ECD68C